MRQRRCNTAKVRPHLYSNYCTARQQHAHPDDKDTATRPSAEAASPASLSRRTASCQGQCFWKTPTPECHQFRMRSKKHNLHTRRQKVSDRLWRKNLASKHKGFRGAAGWSLCLAAGRNIKRLLQRLCPAAHHKPLTT